MTGLATAAIVEWQNTGYTWSVGDTINLSIGPTCSQGVPPTNRLPPALSSLTVTSNIEHLALSWQAPTDTRLPITGYDVHYTSAAAGAVPDGAAASGSDPAAAWVAVSRSGTATKQTIPGLTSGTAYRVRVRAVNAHGSADWAFGTGTPGTPTTGLPQDWPRLDSLTLKVGGHEVPLDPAFGTAKNRQQYKLVVPYDALKLTVEPRWSDTRITATVESRYQASYLYSYQGTRTITRTTPAGGTSPESVESGGSVTVDLNPGKLPEDDTRVGIRLGGPFDRYGAGGFQFKVVRGGDIEANISFDRNPVTEVDYSQTRGVFASPEYVNNASILREKARATILVTLSQPAPRDMLFPVTATSPSATGGTGWFILNHWIQIRRGYSESAPAAAHDAPHGSKGTTYIQATPDDDAENETVVVALAPGHALWPPEVMRVDGMRCRPVRRRARAPGLPAARDRRPRPARRDRPERASAGRASR